MLNSVVGGSVITQVRDSIYLIDVIGRARDVERSSIETYPNLQVPGRNNQSIPLPAFASIGYGLEQPLVWRRARLPTITVKATLVDDATPATVVSQLEPKVNDFIRALPPNYSVTVGGSVEESGKSERPIAAVVPLMLFLMATILMLQLQSFQKLFLVVSVAPLGLIGVVAALAADRHAARLRRHSRRARLDRDHHPQLGDHGDADRRFPREGVVALGRGGRGNRSPHAADPADRGRRQPRHDPDRRRSVLGADGLRDDRWHHHRDACSPCSSCPRSMWPGIASVQNASRCSIKFGFSQVSTGLS